jgi:hypothetical protein
MIMDTWEPDDPMLASVLLTNVVPSFWDANIHSTMVRPLYPSHTMTMRLFASMVFTVTGAEPHRSGFLFGSNPKRVRHHSFKSPACSWASIRAASPIVNANPTGVRPDPTCNTNSDTGGKPKLDIGVWAGSQQWIPKDERSGLLTHIATESVSLCVRMKS